MTNFEESGTLGDPGSVSMRPVAVRYGMITGLIMVVLSLGLQFSGVVDPSTGDGNWISMVLSLAAMTWGLYMAITKHRDDDLGGYITFGRALGTGMLTALIFSLISAVFAFLYFTVIDPEMVEQIKNNAIAQMEEQGMSDADIDQAMPMMSIFMSPIAMTLISLLFNLFFAFILSLILGAVTKKDSPQAV